MKSKKLKESSFHISLFPYKPNYTNLELTQYTLLLKDEYTGKIYDKIILEYIKAIKSGKYDSLMTVSKISGYVWNNKRALSYDSKIEKWPKTQNIKPLNKVNSAVFLSSIDNYKKFKDRIGKRPLMHSLEHPLGFDIDNIDDFRFAETVFKKNKNIYFK